MNKTFCCVNNQLWINIKAVSDSAVASCVSSSRSLFTDWAECVVVSTHANLHFLLPLRSRRCPLGLSADRKFLRVTSQALGVSSQSDRSTVKKKLKELRKAQEKLEKQREKREKEVRRSGRLAAGTDSYC